DGLPLIDWHGNPNYVSIASSSGGQGYWVLDGWGGVWAYGDAVWLGDASHQFGPGTPNVGTPVSLVPTSDDAGYWIVVSNGNIDHYGDAPDFGSLPALGVTPVQPIVGAVPT
ncbi:MAG TPA: hypothetical protein VKG43_10855, partial [Acidimicrobiales bacterium]|nr:hypothetical protein [Acidimicrobiales bacterium]